MNDYLWKLWPMLMLIILMVGGWMTVRYQAQAALSREEALRTFVTIEQYNRQQDSLERRLIRIENKIDRVLEKQ